MLIGRLSCMWSTDRAFIDVQFIFCDHLVCHAFRRSLHITLAKYLEQEGIAGLFSRSFCWTKYVFRRCTVPLKLVIFVLCDKTCQNVSK